MNQRDEEGYLHPQKRGCGGAGGSQILGTYNICTRVQIRRGAAGRPRERGMKEGSRKRRNKGSEGLSKTQRSDICGDLEVNFRDIVKREKRREVKHFTA
eukprot:762715-Hanusia_phi.AAC.5